MGTATESTIDGLDAELVEVMRQSYQSVSDTEGYGNLIRNDITKRFDEVDAIRPSHIVEFNFQLLDGYRCRNCGRHHTEVRINPATNLGDCCDVD